MTCIIHGHQGRFAQPHAPVERGNDAKHVRHTRGRLLERLPKHRGEEGIISTHACTSALSSRNHGRHHFALQGAEQDAGGESGVVWLPLPIQRPHCTAAATSLRFVGG